MQSRGLDPHMIIRVPNQIAQIADAAHLLFEQAKQPTAVVCFNDVIALGLSGGLYDRGLEVGRNFSLIGFDDVTDAEAMRPETHVRFHRAGGNRRDCRTASRRPAGRSGAAASQGGEGDAAACAAILRAGHGFDAIRNR